MQATKWAKAKIEVFAPIMVLIPIAAPLSPCTIFNGIRLPLKAH